MASHQSPPYPDIQNCREKANQLLLEKTNHKVGRHLLAWCEVAEGKVPSEMFEDLLNDTSPSRNVPHHANLGWMLSQCQRSREAINCLSNDLDYDLKNEEIRVFAGICLQRVRDFRTSARVLGEVVEKSPGNLLARRYFADALINSGQWEKGLLELEKSRGALTPLQQAFCQDVSRLWMGQDITGKNIVIVGNDSQSDQIQFSRYVQELDKLNPHNIGFVCNSELVDLIRTIPGINRVDSRVFEPYDFFVPVESLPLRLGMAPGNIPATIPYLHHNHRHSDVKRAGLKKQNMLLGICWRNSRPEVRHESTVGYDQKANSLDLQSFEMHLSALAADYDLVCFQEDLRLDERNILNRYGVTIIEQEEFSNLSVIAEWISCLDLILTVDSPVAHLAGALGIKAHVLLPYVREWKWGAEKGKSPWYPDSVIHEKETENSWESCLEEVMECLVTPLSQKMVS